MAKPLPKQPPPEANQPPKPHPELLSLATTLRESLRTNHIKEGTSKARQFETAFIVGTIAERQATGVEPVSRGYPEICLMSGRSLLDILP